MADDTKAGAEEASATPPFDPPFRGGNAIEQAMSKAIEDVRVESEEIWSREDLSQEEKIKRIDRLNKAEVIRERMAAARTEAVAKMADFEKISLAKANEWISGKPSDAA